MLGFQPDSDTILVMGLTHTQKLAHKWKIVHTHICCPKNNIINDVGLYYTLSPLFMIPFWLCSSLPLKYTSFSVSWALFP